MKRKAWISAVAVLLLLAMLAGCARRETVTLLRQWDPPGGENDVADLAVNTRIGMVADVGGIDDESFNQGAWEGLLALNRETGAPVEYRLSTSSDQYDGNFASLVDAGADLSWGIGYELADAVLVAAKKYPDRHFAIVDSSYDEVPDNVTCVTFRAEEPSFLVGYIAACSTKTGKIGFVGGVEGALIATFEYGFRAGADYAVYTTGKAVEVDVRYSGSFTDAKIGHDMAEDMYSQGCDIVYHAAGGVGLGVIEAAEEAGTLAIGVDRDQSYLSPEHVMTSAMKNVGVAVNRVSQSFIRGEAIGGQVLSFGLAEGAAGIPEEHSLFEDKVYDRTLALVDDIVAGSIVPPATAEEYREFRILLAE